jgi:hypothetical protein
MTNIFDALMGNEKPPATVAVAGIDYTITTDFRDWCRLDTYLFDRNLSDEHRGMWFLNMFAPAVNRCEIDLSSGVYPFDVGDAFDALLNFWMAGRDNKAGSKQGGKQSKERPYDFIHDAAMIYAAFRQAYGIDLTAKKRNGALHWWTFYALFSNLPDGSTFAAAKTARLSDPNDYPKELRDKQRALKEAWALPDNIRYYGTGKGKAMTETEFLDHFKKRREEAQRALLQR